MTVQELIEELQGMPLDAPVILSRDPEGNGFAELQDAVLGGWDGFEVGLLNLTDELHAQGYTEEDVRGGSAVVLWPTH